jgi:TldD protein
VKASTGHWASAERRRLENVQLEDLLQVLGDLDKLIKPGRKDVAFPTRLLMLETQLEEKVYVNSDGAALESRVPRVKYESFVTARYHGRTTSLTIPPGYAQAGESGGWEALERLKLHERVPEHVDALAVVVRSETRLSPQTRDVVLAPEICGLVAHESSGHAGEADRVLGREAAQAGESYLREGSLGRRVGSAEAAASDDPTLPRSMGYYAYDDEGVPARKRQLIRGGIITEFLHNRATAYQFGLSSNAAARAVEFDREPIVRMANTFIEPGDWTLHEMLEDIHDGVLMRSFMEWNIDDKRFNQRYVGLEAFAIHDGEVGKPVRDPVLELTTKLFWSSIDARSKDLRWTTGTCGKGDPMQGIPVWLGGPYVRLRNIHLGSL